MFFSLLPPLLVNWIWLTAFIVKGQINYVNLNLITFENVYLSEKFISHGIVKSYFILLNPCGA